MGMPTVGNDEIGDLGDGIAGIRGVDWEAPTGAEAIAHGRTSWKWEEDSADREVNRRMGTHCEILSWPGCEPYLVKTEGDEAAAQARLRKRREVMRARSQAQAATAAALAQERRLRREAEFAQRQRELSHERQQQKAAEVRTRQEALAIMARDWQRINDHGYGADRWLWPKARDYPRRT